jgi:quercetin dioxygenase-like cupin family protein
VGIGSVCLSGVDTGGAYSLLEVSVAPGVSVPRHTHTREDESYHVLSGELEVVVGEKAFVLKAGDTLMAPRDIPHQLHNPGSTENHFLLIFSPSLSFVGRSPEAILPIAGVGMAREIGNSAPLRPFAGYFAP